MSHDTANNKFKTTKDVGLTLVLGPLICVPGYLLYVRNSGKIIATADITTKTPSPDKKEFSKNPLSATYSYYDLEFSPFNIDFDVPNIKISMFISHGKLIPNSKEIGISNYKNLASPVFQLVDSRTQNVIFEESKEIYYNTINKDLSNNEGKFDGIYYYNIGNIEHLKQGTYTLRTKNILFPKSLIFASRKKISIEIKSNAADFNMIYIIYAVITILAGAIILLLTRNKRSLKRN